MRLQSSVNVKNTLHAQAFTSMAHHQHPRLDVNAYAMHRHLIGTHPMSSILVPMEIAPVSVITLM
jgi:hypothetical protein